MADKFMIKTDEVSSIQSQVSNIASSITETAGTVRGWDTEACEDGFHFNKAKSALAKYLDACAQRVTNTSQALSDVVSKHTDLQNSLANGSIPANDKPEEKEEPSEEPTPAEEPAATPSVPSTGSSSSSSSGPSTESQNVVVPTPAIPSPGRKDDKTKPSSKPSQPKEEEKKEETKQPVTPPEKQPEKQPEEKKEEKQPEETEKPKESSDEKENNPSTPTEDTDDKTENTSSYIEDVSYAAPKQEQLSDESKRIINDVATVSDDGYSKVDDKYVVACDPSIGKVGDNIKITTESGETVDCIVGVNTNTNSNKNKMYFIVDENKSSVKPLDVSKKINSSSKIENLGSYPALSASSTANMTSNVEDNIDDNNSSSEGDDSNG